MDSCVKWIEEKESEEKAQVGGTNVAQAGCHLCLFYNL